MTLEIGKQRIAVVTPVTTSGNIFSESWEGSNAVTGGTGNADLTGWDANDSAWNADSTGASNMPSNGSHCMNMSVGAGGGYYYCRRTLASPNIIYIVFDFQVRSHGMSTSGNYYTILRMIDDPETQTQVKISLANDSSNLILKAEYYDNGTQTALSSNVWTTGKVYRVRVKYDITNSRCDVQWKNVTDSGAYEAVVNNVALSTPANPPEMFYLHVWSGNGYALNIDFDYIDVDNAQYLR